MCSIHKMWCLGFLSIFYIFAKSSAQYPQNPCPDFFQYGRSSNGAVNGRIFNIPYDGSARFTLTVKVSVVGQYNNLKFPINCKTPYNYIQNGRNLQYSIDFPSEASVPKILEIVFNNKIYCQQDGDPVTSDGLTIVTSSSTTTLGRSTGNDLPNYPNHKPLTANSLKNNECGIKNERKYISLMYNAVPTSANEFPWLVAMFRLSGPNIEFICTASTITNRYVITAAHCVEDVKRTSIVLVFGKSDVSNWVIDNPIRRTARDVIPHPEYNNSSPAHCDIALIELNEELKFSFSIRPICLWNFKNSIENSIGVVAGWGTDENNGTPPKVMRTSQPIVSQQKCLASDEVKHLVSSTTFCAGFRDGTGPCHGDSGAPFMIQINDKWYLRGLVSNAISDVTENKCDLNEYVVYADATKLHKWILDEIN